MITDKDIKAWFKVKSWKPFQFQEETWSSFLSGRSGLVNAPTGSGKTYSLLVPIILQHQKLNKKEAKGLSAVWITPIRALGKEILQSTERIVSDLGIDFTVEIRSGDSPAKIKAKHKTKLPNLLITTPESLHILMSQKNFSHLFKNTFSLVADEWHELVGSKRGVQIELALTRLRALNPQFRTWGISATVGNLAQATEVLLGTEYLNNPALINSGIEKKIEVKSIIPDEIEKFPWGGHLGINLLKKVVPIIQKSESTLIFTNTRAQSEIWYQKLMNEAPELAGLAALHHGSLSKKVRHWVEDALQSGDLKVVICTSSLDLGVDFTPVETIIQVGGPKGVSRFMQRAGRSGHRPGAVSRIYFLPTHSLELIEASALRQAIKDNFVESVEPFVRSFDVLLQYLMTLAVGEGFRPETVFEQIKSSHAYASISEEEWNRTLAFLANGGNSLKQYDEYKKTEVEDGLVVVKDRRLIRNHKMSIGTIVSDGLIKVKYKNGGLIGQVEEWFVSRLKPGDVFWFSGRSLELVSLKQMAALVINSKRKTGPIPSYQGGKLPMSSNMGEVIRQSLDRYINGELHDPEILAIKGLLDFQESRSKLPSNKECLIEYFKTAQGYHLIIYPFEGRFVNEGIASLLAYRISQTKSISFSMAFNSYGFELLSDQFYDIQEIVNQNFLSTENLYVDVLKSINDTEMAKRRFREIASISGLIFKGFPGQEVKDRHLQSSSELFFKVFSEYDPNNLLLLQSYEEAMSHQLEYERLRKALQRIEKQNIVLSFPERPSPFGFPIMVERLREKLSSESLKDRVEKLSVEYE